MRILLLVHSFNSLSQRLYVELTRAGHELSVELDIHERVTCEAVDLFEPDVVLAPFLKRAIPPSVWHAPSVSDRASGATRRSRSGGARLGDPAWRADLGCHRAAGDRRAGCRAGVGEYGVRDALRVQEQPVSK
jgi:hypothetical protein